ncbi:hypothetical protein LXL04_007482 [Taraxacum kok-saghyz]
MTDSKKPPTPYVVLENRTLDQWKVTELKEELKRRKLLTRGLKEDLVKRLDEAVRSEIEEAKQNHENGVNDDYHPEVPSDAIVDPVVPDKTMDDTIPKNEDNVTEKVDKNEKLDQDNINEKLNKDESLEKDKVTEKLDDEINKELQESKPLLPKEEEEEAEQIGSQVVEVSQVKSDSISIVSITEKNDELKDNVIADDVDVKLELDLKQPSVVDVGKSEPVVVVDDKDSKIAETKNDILDVASPEKLNLDDDSMEEDTLESKQIDSNFTSQDITQKTQPPVLDVMVDDKNTEIIKEKTDPAVLSTKRKQFDQEEVENSEVVKRQRRRNSENAPEQQNINPSLSTTPKTSMKHSFSRSDSSVSHEEPKERVGEFFYYFVKRHKRPSHLHLHWTVPPSQKPATTSLRIDRFLRPFTLKAVQELLGKTGTVVSFWMDNIKTHCYVTYSSVEEAVETRNAVYNLQWPANGGRLLMAEFVDPFEVKTRTEPPPPTPVTTTPALPQPPPATIQPPPQHHLPPPPPLPLPPPPPLAQSREPPTQHHLPPPPPLEPPDHDTG